MIWFIFVVKKINRKINFLTRLSAINAPLLKSIFFNQSTCSCYMLTNTEEWVKSGGFKAEIDCNRGKANVCAPFADVKRYSYMTNLTKNRESTVKLGRQRMPLLTSRYSKSAFSESPPRITPCRSPEQTTFHGKSSRHRGDYNCIQLQWVVFKE